MLLVDRVPVVELCLVGTISFLSCVVWQQRRPIAALESNRLAVERSKHEGGNRVCAQAVVEHTAPTAIPHDTESVPEAIPNEVAESVPEAIPNSVNDTERVEVTERHAA